MLKKYRSRHPRIIPPDQKGASPSSRRPKSRKTDKQSRRQLRDPKRSSTVASCLFNTTSMARSLKSLEKKRKTLLMSLLSRMMTNKLPKTKMTKIQKVKRKRKRRQSQLMMKKKLTVMKQTRLTRARFRSRMMKLLQMIVEKSFTSNTMTNWSVTRHLCQILTKMMSHSCWRLILNRSQSVSEKLFSRRKISKAPKFFSSSRLKTSQLESRQKVDPRVKTLIQCSGFLSQRKIQKLP